jgi:hypothetical protein
MNLFLTLVVSMSIMLGLSLSPAHSISTTLYPTVDTSVSTYSDGNDSYWNNGLLQAGKNNFTYRAYLKFDLSSIPDGSIINSAKLTLYHAGGSATGPYALYHIPADSTVTNSLTWNTQPSAGVYLDNVSYYAFASSLTWNLLQAWSYSDDLKDNFLSLLLKYYGDDIGTNSTIGQFYGSESEPGAPHNPPRLVVEYQLKPVPIPGAICLLAPGLAGLIAMRRRFKRGD